MNSLEYLKSELATLANRFTKINIKYGFNKKIEAHIVELLPENEYYTNKELDKAWIDISVKFNEKFIDEEIVFISSDSTLSNTEVIFEFNSPILCTEGALMSELFASLYDQEVAYTIDTSFTTGKIIAGNKGTLINEASSKNIHMPKVNENNSYSIAA